jgi:hypothetical protein
MNKYWIYKQKARRHVIRKLFGKVRTNSCRKKLVILIGPESSGTRVFTSVLSQHPKILGTPVASDHLDILDDVWRNLEIRNIKSAIHDLPDFNDYACILTRRSMPHARTYGEPAIFMDFSDLIAMNRLCKRMDLDMVLLTTSRSYIPNILSWTQNRLSAQRSIEKAALQYQASYRYLFNFINKTGTPYYMLSLEGLILDGQEYVQSIFQMLGLPKQEIDLDLRAAVNLKYYRQFNQEASDGLPAIHQLLDKGL